MKVQILVTLDTTQDISPEEEEDLRSNVWWAIRHENDNVGLSEFNDENNIVETFTAKLVRQ